MNFRIKNNKIAVDKYIISALYNGRKIKKTVFSEEERDEFTSRLNSDNENYINLSKVTPDEFAQSEELAVVYREHNAGTPEESHESASITFGEIVHGEWTKHKFEITDANYGVDRLFIKYGNDINEKQWPMYIRDIKVYSTDKPDKYADSVELDDRYSTPVEAGGYSGYETTNWSAIVLTPDTKAIKKGTKHLIVELSYFIERFDGKEMPAEKDYPVQDISVEKISQPDIEWADGEEVRSYEEAVKLLEDNMGRWKNQEEYMAHKRKDIAIYQTKLWLKKELEKPFEWIDGKIYTVSNEKQELLNRQLTIGNTQLLFGYPKEKIILEWNETGKRHRPWTYPDLVQLAADIHEYVEPLIVKQQESEIIIRKAVNLDEIESILKDFN